MNPFTTSVFEALTCIFATVTKICTRSCFIQAYDKSFINNSTMPSNALRHRLTTLIECRSNAKAPSTIGARKFGR